MRDEGGSLRDSFAAWTLAMPSLLVDNPEPDDRPNIKALIVNGRPYSNTAAKFWPSLLDEVTVSYPECTSIELHNATSDKLSPEHLRPEHLLTRAMKHLENGNLEQVLKDALAEIELFGPPAPVTIRLLSNDVTILDRPLPIDAIDAELMPFLSCWLLEWSEIPRTDWNNTHLAGEVTAENRHESTVYRFVFSIDRRHVREGLYNQTLRLTLCPCTDEQAKESQMGSNGYG